MNMNKVVIRFYKTVTQTVLVLLIRRVNMMQKFVANFL